MLNRPDDAATIVVLSGAGLSVAAGVPRFHEKSATWQGKSVGEIATVEGFSNDPDTVREFYDDCRAQLATMLPTVAHDALARLQQRWGHGRVTLVSQNIDGLLDKAGAPQVIEMYGSLLRLACTSDPSHPAVGVFGVQNPAQRCRLCGGTLRPDVVWFGEGPRREDEVRRAASNAKIFVAVGVSSESKRGLELAGLANANGATTIEINPKPVPGPYDHVIAEPAAGALASIVGEWLGEESD